MLPEQRSPKLEAWSLYGMGSTLRDFLEMKKELGSRMIDTTVFQIVFYNTF